ncbi:hypothetical protein QQS21_003321 [Conoideocrella luteorostrata]|uniref:Isochorismatase-like domain-containing protein n=1 Tax=Conoideocrella luteorostrata TaxID=1105319 RepID=A0AAJ0FWH0_9HYPO|nr:hypothetical protein QQS21_003321 [Conoideocrella luteorostrata]
MAPLLPPSTTRTVIVLIDIQQGLTHPTHWGPERSTPSFESNVSRVLQSVRQYNQRQPETPILIIHVHNHSTRESSPLHPTYILQDAGSGGAVCHGVQPMQCAEPSPSEPVLIKNVNSAFIGTGLEARLRAFKAQQLIMLGLSTDECVSTSVRMAANLKVLADVEGISNESRIVVLRDATAAWAKGGYDAETVHGVHLASLDEEFASVALTLDVVGALMQTGA